MRDHTGKYNATTFWPCKKRSTKQIYDNEVPSRFQGEEEIDQLATAAADLSKCSQEYVVDHEGLQTVKLTD